MQPLVSVCIPAYKSDEKLGAAIDSALSQTVREVEIIVSNDGGHPLTALDAYRAHPSVRIIDQPQRLGWVENSNFALSQALGQYFMILPHDDRIEPTYLEECLAILDAEPTVFAVHSDVNTSIGLFKVKEVRGDLNARIEEIFKNQLSGFSYHALMRRNPKDWPYLKLKRNPPSDYLVDTIFILQQALFGEIRRIDKPLFYKYAGPETTHVSWQNLPPLELTAGWTNHCKLMEKAALEHVSFTSSLREIFEFRRNPHNIKDCHPYMRVGFEG